MSERVSFSVYLHAQRNVIFGNGRRRRSSDLGERNARCGTGGEGEGRNLGRRRRDRLLNFYERLFILAKFAKIATLLRSFFFAIVL